MNIKKTMAVIIAAAAMALTFAGCNSESDSSKGGNSSAKAANATVNTDVAATADKLNSEIKFDEKMAELDDAKIGNIIGVAKEKYSKAKCYINETGATPEEIDCFEAVDENAAKEIKDILQSRIDTQKARFKDYNAEQAPKLEEPVFEVNGKYVYLCISGDNSKAKEIIG